MSDDTHNQALKLIASQDQDIEAAKDWIRSHPTESILGFVRYIAQDFTQGTFEGGPPLESMSRFAQIGITHVWLAISEEEKDNGTR